MASCIFEGAIYYIFATFVCVILKAQKNWVCLSISKKIKFVGILCLATLWLNKIIPNYRISVNLAKIIYKAAEIFWTVVNPIATRETVRFKADG